MSSSPHVVPARFRFGRDPESELVQPSVIHADELMLRRWFRLHDRGRPLSRAELELLIEDMSAHPELWRHLLRRSPDQRHDVQMLLDVHVEIWLICRCPTQETGVHDHGACKSPPVDRRIQVGSAFVEELSILDEEQRRDHRGWDSLEALVDPIGIAA